MKHLIAAVELFPAAKPRRTIQRRNCVRQTLRSQTLRSPDLPANIFGEMLRDVLALAPVPKKEIPALKETGFFIGRFIYLCDAWDDRESDQKAFAFQPVQYLRLYPR